MRSSSSGCVDFLTKNQQSSSSGFCFTNALLSAQVLAGPELPPRRLLELLREVEDEEPLPDDHPLSRTAEQGRV